MKIMKKSFSFVCCLFLAVSCFAPYAFAKLPEDGEKIYLTPMSNPDIKLVPYVSSNRYELVDGPDCDEGTRIIADNVPVSVCSWEAHKVRECVYVLTYFSNGFVGYTCSPNLALDEDVGSGRVNLWSAHAEENQQWEFEYYRYNYYRIRNVATGRYLTYDPKGVVSWDFVDESSSIFEDQLWCKH